jgi:hypothetical protein
MPAKLVKWSAFSKKLNKKSTLDYRKWLLLDEGAVVAVAVVGVGAEVGVVVGLDVAAVAVTAAAMVAAMVVAMAEVCTICITKCMMDSY